MRRYLHRANRGNAQTRIARTDAFGLEPRLPIDRIETRSGTPRLDYASNSSIWRTRWRRLRAMMHTSRKISGQLAIVAGMLASLILLMIGDFQPMISVAGGIGAIFILLIILLER